MAYSGGYGADSGGGYANVLALDPAGQGRYLVGGDVWGARASEDGGNSYHGQSQGQTNTHAVAYSKKFPGAKLIAYGPAHGTGGADGTGDVMWSPAGSGVMNLFDTHGFGVGAAGGGGDGRRPVGDRIVTDLQSATEYIYTLSAYYGLARYTLAAGAASLGDASAAVVLKDRSSLPGTSFYCSLCLVDSNHLFAVAFDHDDAGTIINSKIWMITSSGGNLGTATASTVTATQLTTGVPNHVYDIHKGKDSHYYAACGFDGVYEISSNGLTWTHIATLDNQVSSVDADSARNLWVGQCGTNSSTFANDQSMTAGHGWAKLAWAGSTWGAPTYMTSRAGAKEWQPGDTTLATGRDWWLWSNGPDFNAGGYDASIIRIDPFDDDIVIACGRSGAWMTRDGGAHINPSMRGLNGSEVNNVRCNGGNVSTDDIDWTGKNSSDQMQTCVKGTFSSAGNGKNCAASPASTTLVGLDGATYVFTPADTGPATLTRNGIDIADDAFRWAVTGPNSMAADALGNVYFALHYGGVFVQRSTTGGPVANSWKQVNPHGAGFQNTGAVGPWSGHNNVVLIGADTAGIHKSTNKGTLFANRNADVTGVDVHIASIEPHPTQAGRFFALTGNGTTGSLLETTDYGDTWTDVSSGTANIYGDGALSGNSGANSLLGNGNGEHPRSVGRLISIDASGSRIYVGTFEHGVYRGVVGATSGVTSWAQIGLTSNYYVRGVLWDSTNSALYASTFSDPGSDFTTTSGHIFRCTNPTAGSPTFTALTGSPMCGSAMLVLGDQLFTVAHPITTNLADKGLWYLNTAHSASAGTAWTKIGALPTNTNARWMSLDGYRVGSVTTLWCGSASDGAHSLYKISNASGSWVGTLYPTNFNTVQNDMGGPNTPADQWWFYSAHQGFMIGKPTFVASTIRVDQLNPTTLYVFGRSGAWRSIDNGQTWYPIVKGIGATVTLTAIADPTTQGRVYIGLGDWSILASADSLANVIAAAPPTGSFSYAACIDEKTTPVTLITAASPRQDAATFTSTIWTNPNALGGGVWSTTGFSASNVIVTGVCAIYTGATRVLLATTSGGDLWRKQGGNAWAKIAAAAMTPNGSLSLASTDTTPFARKIDRAETYLYDRSVGVYRSTNAGASWTRIWNHASGNSDQAGWVAVHPTNPAILYASDHTSVYKITNANTCGQDAATVVTIGNAIGARGPMCVDPVNNKIGVCDITSTPRWWESDLATISWSDRSDALYQNAVAAPQWASYDRAGNVIIALSGNGALLSDFNSTALTAPAFTTKASISGEPIAGNTLTGVDGTVIGNPTPTLGTRTWYADGVSVHSGATFTIPSTTLDGQVITYSVTATNSQGTATSTSDATAAVTTPAAPPIWTVPPSISGETPPNGEDGDTLTVDDGTFSPGSISARQWQTSPTSLPGSAANIGGATSTTLDTTGKTGQYLRCHLTADNGGVTNTADTEWVGPLAAAPSSDVAPSNVTVPSISGGTTVGSVLTLNIGEWDGSPTPVITQQWQTLSDGIAADIAGETGLTYITIDADVDSLIQCVVTATNTAGEADETTTPTVAIRAPISVQLNQLSDDLAVLAGQVAERGL